jgi:pyruvate kinase
MSRGGVIVSLPPYAPFAPEVASHPYVVGLRLNTAMPVQGQLEHMLFRLESLGKPLFVEIKGRRLRVVEPAIPPFTEVRLSHPIRVRTPARAHFGVGGEVARIVSVDGDRVILSGGPQRLVPPGEPITIPDPSLEILGTLTGRDREWLHAMRAVNVGRVMLSVTEQPSDLDEVRAILPSAEIVLEITTARGLGLVADHGSSLGRLAAGRGGLWVEMGRPHRMVSALQRIVEADPNAFVLGRFLPSLAQETEHGAGQPATPSPQDVGDLAFLLFLGFRTFVLSDALCQRREHVLAALDVIQSVAGELS